MKDMNQITRNDRIAEQNNTINTNNMKPKIDEIQVSSKQNEL